MPPELRPGQFRRHTDHAVQHAPREAARAGLHKPRVVRRKRKKGEMKKRENRTERKKREFELNHIEGVGEGYQQEH